MSIVSPGSFHFRSVSDDDFPRRLSISVVAAVALNLILWATVASAIRSIPHYHVIPVEITRVLIDKTGKKREKVVTKKQIEKKVAQVHHEIQHRHHEIKPVVLKEPRHQEPPKAKPVHVAQKPPPQGAHSHVLAAPPDPIAPPKPNDHTVLPGGNADPGKVIAQQNPGEAKVNPVEPITKPEPKPEQKPVPKSEPKPSPKPDPVPEVKSQPNPEPKPEPPTPPEPTPKPKGPTRDADPVDQAKPEIPDELKHSDYKSFVRVKVEIEADGSFTPILRTSSGNPEIDRRVLDSLKRWKWRPALKDGGPVKSTQLFKFEFIVE